MKYFAFVISFLFTLSLAIALAIPFGSVPPLGKLLDPYHGFWQNSYSEDDLAETELELKNLEGIVEVVYDQHLIPHIFAQNDEDLYRVQGYITAKHRLWQMEFQTMAAAGRISEIVGPIALDLDRMTRRKGLTYGAEIGMQYLKNQDQETLKLLEAFADGVNQFIDQMTPAQLPIEYKILNYSPEHWTAYKSILLLKYMTDMLMNDKDLEFTNTRKLIGDELLEKFFPEFPDDNDPIIEADKKWDFTPIEVQTPLGIEYPNSGVFINTLPFKEPGIGSNNWAVSGAKTKSGHTILANDPHLSLNLPSLWFVMQLTTPSHSTKGATLPGALGIISGYNEDIAWGVTNAARDVADWYAINFKNKDRIEYEYNNQWIQSTLRIEEIKIKGSVPFLDSVIYTHYGPVVYDRNFRSERADANFALKWTLHMESNEQKTFLALNHAKNHEEYTEALNYYSAPPQNFAFASRTGDIAMKVQGKFPLKWKGQGKFLMDGSNPEFEWKGFIPSEHNPSTLNPVRGFVSSTNQHPVDPSYPYYIFNESFEHYRNRRLNSELTRMEDITVDDMKTLQFDNFHLHAFEALPVLLGFLEGDSLVLRDENALKYMEKLRDWDFHTHPNENAPTLFHIWWTKVYAKVWDSWRSSGLPVVLPNNYETTKLLMMDPQNSVFDDPKTSKVETALDVVKWGFLEMVSQVVQMEIERGNYTYAEFKNTSIQHMVPNFKSFGREKIITGGGRGILNATSERHGASWRFVVEMGDEISAFGIYPGGQSGNPGSRFYESFISQWAKGEYLDLNLRKADDLENLLFRTKYIP